MVFGLRIAPHLLLAVNLGSFRLFVAVFLEQAYGIGS